MRRIINFHLLAGLLVLCFSASSAFAQSTAEVAPEKRKVIAEIISITKADQKASEVMGAMFKQMNADYPSIVKGIVGKQSGLTADQKADLEAEMISRQNDFDQRFQRKMMQAINFQEFVEATVYPLYDKNFTEAELRDLLAFYKTPTGQKLNEVTPQIAADSIRLASEYLMPKIDRIFDEVVKEQMSPKGAAATGAPPKRKTN